MELVKWVFLLRQETCLVSDTTFYDFVPYKYGPFSFTMYRDFEELCRLGYLSKENYSVQSRSQAKAIGEVQSLKSEFQQAIKEVLSQYSHLSQRQLLEIIYRKYPWFASRSELKGVVRVNIPKGKTAVYTTGYEGKSIDMFLQGLLMAGIERIVDVRNNPVSRKYGFSKRTLSRLIANLKIDYVHMPALGVPSSDRQFLTGFEEYQELMRYYEQVILPGAPDARQEVGRLLRECPSVLVCFEADWRYCHRGCLAKAISSDTGLEVVHI
jgi:uncharacterized protein (DUF488 family)